MNSDVKTPPICAQRFVHVTGWLTAGPESGDIDPVGEDLVEGIAFSFAVVVSAGAVDVKRALGSVDSAPSSEVISDEVLRISSSTSAIKHEIGPPIRASARLASALDLRD